MKSQFDLGVIRTQNVEAVEMPLNILHGKITILLANYLLDMSKTVLIETDDKFTILYTKKQVLKF